MHGIMDYFIFTILNFLSDSNCKKLVNKFLIILFLLKIMLKL